MSVKRSDNARLLEKHGFHLVGESANHSIYSDGVHTIPPKRHRAFDRITANELCKQAGLPKRF